MKSSSFLKTTPLLLLFWAMLGRAIAQVALVGEPINIRNDYGYEIIGRLGDHVLLFRDQYEEFEVVAFDNRLREDWDKQINLEKHGVAIVGVVGGKRDFSVVYRAKRRNQWLLRLNKYDEEASLIDSVTLKTWPSNPFFTPKLEMIKSADRNTVAVFDRSTGQRAIPVTCFRLDKMQLLWSRDLDLGDWYSENSVADFSLSNAGEFFLVSDMNNRRGRLEDHHFDVRQMSAAGDRDWQVPVPEYVTYDLQFSFDEKNGRLAGAGFYGEKNIERARGYFFTAVSPSAGVVVKPRFEPFSDQFLTIMEGKEASSNTSRGLTDLEVATLVFRQDGGLLLVGEQRKEVMRGGIGTRAGPRGDAGRAIVDYFYDDFFAIATGPDGGRHWESVLHKKQYSQDDDGNFSSFFTVAAADRLHFLFNDDIRFESTCSEYVIDPAGHFDRNSLLNTADQSLRLRFREGLQIGAAEALIPSEWRGKLRLVLFRFDGARI